MRFSTSTLSLVTGALVATSAMGELTKVTRCAPSQPAKRADKFVDMGNFDYGQDGDTITTDGLATCMGVAIVGDCGEEGEICDDRWLAHATATDLSSLEEVIVQAQHAIDEGLVNLRIQAVFMDPAAEEEDFVQAATDVNNEALEVISDLFDGVTPLLHPASEWYFLTINNDKTFSYGVAADSDNDGDESMEDFYDEYD